MLASVWLVRQYFRPSLFWQFGKFGAAMLFSFLPWWHSVPETPSYGTEYARRAQKGFLGYATHFQKHSV